MSMLLNIFAIAKVIIILFCVRFFHLFACRWSRVDVGWLDYL